MIEKIKFFLQFYCYKGIYVVAQYNKIHGPIFRPAPLANSVNFQLYSDKNHNLIYEILNG